MIHKEAAFLQKYIFEKNSFFTLKSCVKKQYFYNRLICKKAAFLHKNGAFLQGPFFYATYIYIFIIYEHLNKRVVLLLI